MDDSPTPVLFASVAEETPWEWAKARRVVFTTPQRDVVSAVLTALVSAMLDLYSGDVGASKALGKAVLAALVGGAVLPFAETLTFRLLRPFIQIYEAANRDALPPPAPVAALPAPTAAHVATPPVPLSETPFRPMFFEFKPWTEPWEETYVGHSTDGVAMLVSPSGVPGMSTLRWTQKIVRVCVHNPNDRTVSGVRVVLQRTNPLRAVFNDVLLHQQHDNPADGQPFQQSFSLGPRGKKFIDVAFQDTTHEFAKLFHIVRNVTQDLPDGTLKIVLCASSLQTAPTEWAATIHSVRRKHEELCLVEDAGHAELLQAIAADRRTEIPSASTDKGLPAAAREPIAVASTAARSEVAPIRSEEPSLGVDELTLEWKRREAGLGLRLTNQAGPVLQNVRVLLVDLLVWHEPRAMFCQTQNFHSAAGGTFAPKVLGVFPKIFAPNPVECKFISGSDKTGAGRIEHLVHNDRTAATTDLPRLGKYRAQIRIEAAGGKARDEFLCFQFVDNEFPLRCDCYPPQVSKAAPPIKPVRG